MTIVSNNIKYLRRLNGLTQEQFARRIGIKRSLLGAYEEARANPNLENLKMIAQVFGTSVDALIKTDIRRIRETPGINLIQSPNGIAQLMTAQANKPENAAPVLSEVSVKEVPEEQAPQRIATIVDKYLRDKDQVKLVSQRIFPKRVRIIHTESEGVLSPIQEKVQPESRLPIVEETKVLSTAASIYLVTTTQQKEYASHFQRKDFIERLPAYSFPVNSPEKHRAFEIGEDFPMGNAIVVGKTVSDWSAIKDGKHYLLVTLQGKVIYRRVYNQSKIKGTLLLSSDNHSIQSIEIPIKEVCEVWEAVSYFCNELPETPPPLDKIRGLLKELNLLIGD